MTLAIDQSHQYAGNDYWHWRAWIAGGADELARIEKVKWFLHPTFSPSVVVSRDRGSGFAIERSGWGTFTLRAELSFVDGSDRTLRQRLRLVYPEPVEGGDTPPASAQAQADARQRTVYLSYASADSRTAAQVRRAIEAAGLAVLDASAIKAGEPLQLALQDMLTRADAVVGVVNGDLPSAFVAQEIQAAFNSGKPTRVLVRRGSGGPVAGLPSEVQVVALPAEGDVAASDSLGSALAVLAESARAQ